MYRNFIHPQQSNHYHTVLILFRYLFLLKFFESGRQDNAIKQYIPLSYLFFTLSWLVSIIEYFSIYVKSIYLISMEFL